ncbi:hypothetical protein [Legionella sp. 28fT52]|uniref:hypothetical protein n=1 Tax=Legionella sp. 28fT52 TaxID=3410134 RepID=UPI003AF494F0
MAWVREERMRGGLSSAFSRLTGCAGKLTASFGAFIAMSAGWAGDEDLTFIRPTGFWYSDVVIDYFKLDGCMMPVYDEYVNLSPSQEAVKEVLFNQHYQGGSCREVMEETDQKPADWPLGVRQWQVLLAQNPDSPRPITLTYYCMQAAIGDYQMRFTISPQYRCLYGSCRNYRKACAGDVYAGDLLQTPIELAGHTGLIYTADDYSPSRAYLVMEVLNKPPVIHVEEPLEKLEKERPIWGVRYGYGKLNQEGEMHFFDALKIASLGFMQSQFCPQYTLKPIYRPGGFETVSITDPISHQLKTISTPRCAVFRCDTFVQYLYKEGLNTQLPPQTPLHMPKDLFDAFPNQRQDAQQLPLRKAHELIRDAQPVNTSEKKQTLKSLLSAIEVEQNGEEKSRLLFTVFQHLKANPISRMDWKHLKSMLPSLLNNGEDGRVIANAFLVSGLVLPENEQVAMLNSWLRHNDYSYSEGDRLLIEKTIHLLFFERLVNAKTSSDFTEERVLLTLLNKERLLESFSVYLQEFPKEKLQKPVKQFLRDFLAEPSSDWFRRDGLFKAHYRVNVWAGAMLRLSEQPNEETFFQLAAGISDPVVLSLLAAGNPSFLATEAQKRRFLRHLKEATRVKNAFKTDEKLLLHQMIGKLSNDSSAKRKSIQ